MRLIFALSVFFITHVLAAQCPLGLKIDQKAYNKTPVLTPISNELQESASLIDYCPKPGNQLYHLTSAGWATSYYATTILYARQSKKTDVEIISKESFAPTFTHYVVQGDNVNCTDAPISIKESLDVLVADGVPSFRDYPYFCPEKAPSDVKMSPISGYNRLFNSYDQVEIKTMKIKTVLSQGLPVIIALQASSSFCEPGAVWSPSKPTEPSKHHAICIIGYDDTRYGGSFELINSWGKDWGTNGYIHVPYTNLIDRISEAYTAFLLPDSQEFKMEIDVSSNAGSNMPIKASKQGIYQFTKGYGNGHQFNFEVNTDFKGYLYLYYFNNRGENGLLFPRNETTSGVLPFNAASLTLPEENTYVQLDNQPGKETMVVILSMSPLSKDQIQQKIKETPNKSLRLDPEKLQFKGTINNTQPNVFIQIELDHI